MQTTDLLPEHHEAPERPARRVRGPLRFTCHVVELLAAVLAGMIVFGWALHAVLAATGSEYSARQHPELVILEMGLTAALGVGGWMVLRGRGRARASEMGAAVLAPAVAVLPLMWLGLMSSATALLVEHVAMIPLVLAVMLRRRQEYLLPRPAGPVGRLVRAAAGRGGVRRIAGAVLVLVAVAALPAGLLAVASASYAADRYLPTPASAAAERALATAAAPAHVPGRPTAVVVVGNGGANVADALAPYEVLSATGAFNVYLVAPERRPVPLLGGLDVIPDLSIAELEQRLGGAAPDVTVVPEMPASAATDRPVTDWLAGVPARGGLVLGVCTGARLIAEAGLLDGRDATSHWYRLAALEKDHPDVRWQRGIRYVDDGNVITTGGLLSSVDGSLRVVERFLGTEAAAAAARTVAWNHYSPGSAAPLPGSGLTPGDALLHLVITGFRADTTTVGVVLADGVGELELAAAFDPYTEAKAARTLSFAAGGDSIRSRHGLTFVPRADLQAGTGAADWLIVPGATAPAVPGSVAVPTTYLHRQPGFAFDEPLREIARRMDVPTATWTAKLLELPTAGLGLTGSSWPWAPTFLALGLGLTGLVAALGGARLVRRVRARRS